ncbi:MAG: oxygenase MpaB family protein, partial [Patulibacter sp.]|nr:oxygenase MpaB family protein [Patulibacter sp.]
MRRDHWKRVNDALDPETSYVEIYRNVVAHEFPWDMNQALSFALFRTYAVPGIGRLLDATGEFTGNVQQRYDDTALLLEPPSRYGFDHPEAKAAIRRINQMHRAYDIPDHEFRYVLSTFVVVPKRWLDDYGKRPLTPTELEASVQYYRTLGRHMGIKDVPETYEGFAELMDSY